MTFEDSATVRDYTNYTEDSNNNNYYAEDCN